MVAAKSSQHMALALGKSGQIRIRDQISGMAMMFPNVTNQYAVVSSSFSTVSMKMRR